MIKRVSAKKAVKKPSKSGGLYFASPKEDVEFIPTGAKVLDLIMGGGWARRRIGNIYGDASTGKTLLMIEACRNFYDTVPKGQIRYREAEESFDQDYAQALGLPANRIDLDLKLDTVEDMFEDLAKVCEKATAPELYIVDSLDALSFRAELGRPVDQAAYGGEKAKVLSKLFRNTVRQLADKDVTLLLVSQLRDTFARFGKTKKPSGGKGLEFYCSQRMGLIQTGVLKKTIRGVERPTGITVKAKMDKNKVGLPFRETAFDIRFGFGVDDAAACVKWLQTTGHLDDVELAKKDVPKYFKQLDAMDRRNFDLELKDLRKAVERRYFEIEESFLPKRSKYE